MDMVGLFNRHYQCVEILMRFKFVEMVVILARVVSSIDEMSMRTVVMSSFTPTLGQRSIWTIQPSCFQFYS